MDAFLSTPEVHRLLNGGGKGKIGINRLREAAHDEFYQRQFGIRFNGRKPLWSKRRVLAWMEQQQRHPGGQLGL